MRVRPMNFRPPPRYVRRTAPFLAALGLAAAVASPAICAPEERQSSTIDWAAAKRQAEQDRSAHANDVAEVRASIPASKSLDAVALPVLLITGAEETRAGTAFDQQRTSYVAFYRLVDAQLAMTGASTALSPSSDKDAKPAEADGEIFLSTEEGADLSFTRYGATYLLRLTCDHDKDKRCTEPGYLSGVARSLVVAGGQP